MEYTVCIELSVVASDPDEALQIANRFAFEAPYPTYVGDVLDEDGEVVR